MQQMGVSVYTLDVRWWNKSGWLCFMPSEIIVSCTSGLES